MTAYVIRRVIQAIIVMLIVSIMVFLALRLLPGDPILMIVNFEDLSNLPPDYIENLRIKHGLNIPLPEQYLNWLFDMLRGDLGMSIIKKEPVMIEMSRRLPITLNLAIPAIILSVIVGVPMGIISAVRRGTWIDTVVTLSANIGITVPAFWLGIMLIYLFGLQLQWLPLYGYTSPMKDFSLHLQQLVMPVFVLSLFALASKARQTRSSMLEVMGQDYIRTAWSKGLKERVIITKHALKNGLIPIATLIGISFKNIVGGSVLVETVFNIPGLGRLAVDAVTSRDYPVVQAFIVYIAAIVVFTNLLVDLSYGWLDPRIRYE
jgi:peptide/nickel transport system permease protein